MKTLRLFLALSILTLGTSAIADHNGGRCNLVEASSLSYQLADIGERYAYGYQGNLSYAANALHHSATSLYYAIGNLLSHGGRYDHQGGGYRILDQLADDVGYKVDGFAYYAPSDLDSWTRSLYYSLRNNLNCY